MEQLRLSVYLQAEDREEGHFQALPSYPLLGLGCLGGARARAETPAWSLRHGRDSVGASSSLEELGALGSSGAARETGACGRGALQAPLETRCSSSQH